MGGEDVDRGVAKTRIEALRILDSPGMNPGATSIGAASNRFCRVAYRAKRSYRTFALHVEVLDVDCVVLDEAAAFFDVLAHQDAEDAVGLARVQVRLLEVGHVL